MLVFNRPSIGYRESVQVTITGSVLSGYQQFLNHALVMADGVIPVHASLVTVVAQPDAWLRLNKTGYEFVLSGDDLVYTLSAQNAGDSTAYDVTLVDVLPENVPLLGASPPPDEITPPVLRWSLGDLAPGARRTVVVTTTAPSVQSVFTNTALLDSRQSVVTQTVLRSQTVGSAAILRVTKQGSPETVVRGRDLVYTLQYRNAGNLEATGVWLTDTIPVGLSVIGTNPSPDSTSGQQYAWDLGTLAPGASGTIVISTTVGGKGSQTLVNIADIMGQPGSFPGHAELETDVELLWMFVPLVTKNFP
jgi:uncharacterized repeat protein (TIGR01451 family)